MARTIYIPEEVKASIAEHLRQATAKGVAGYSCGETDEDVLTGDFGACLRTGPKVVTVRDGNHIGPWEWSISYRKFRGRGKGAPEKTIGADGIFVLSLNRMVENRPSLEEKALLFQAKKDWSSDSNLFEQAVRLSTWREAAFVLNYTADRYEAYALDAVIQSNGKKTAETNHKDVAELLLSDFLQCKIGDADLKYYHNQGRLVWRTAAGFVSTTFKVRHQISIDILGPGPSSLPEVKNDKLSDHRMAASAEQILGVPPDATSKRLKQAYNAVALAYHPDKHSKISDLVAEILKRRMQEFNRAKAELRKKEV